jgi:hypothetical protein
MQSKQNLNKVLEKLPYGSLILIAERSNCSRQAVSKFFKGELKTLKKINVITKETSKLLVELKKNAEELESI